MLRTLQAVIILVLHCTLTYAWYSPLAFGRHTEGLSGLLSIVVSTQQTVSYEDHTLLDWS